MNLQAVYCSQQAVFIYGLACAGVEGYMTCTPYLVNVLYIETCDGGGEGNDGGGVGHGGGGSGVQVTIRLSIVTAWQMEQLILPIVVASEGIREL